MRKNSKYLVNFILLEIQLTNIDKLKDIYLTGESKHIDTLKDIFRHYCKYIFFISFSPIFLS